MLWEYGIRSAGAFYMGAFMWGKVSPAACILGFGSAGHMASGTEAVNSVCSCFIQPCGKSKFQ